jgi:hypothetical protein
MKTIKISYNLGKKHKQHHKLHMHHQLALLYVEALDKRSLEALFSKAIFTCTLQIGWEAEHVADPQLLGKKYQRCEGSILE